MRLSYAQMEELIAALHGVSPSCRTALKGRIKHFQRNGWPRGTNTGKGKPAQYRGGEVLALCLAFELTQIGLSPDRTVEVLEAHWNEVREAAFMVLGGTDIDDPLYRTFLYCDPAALGHLSQPGNRDRATASFRVIGKPELMMALRTAEFDPRRFAIINLSTLFNDAWERLVEFQAPVPSTRREAYMLWMGSL